MAVSTGAYWVTPPSVLRNNLGIYSKQLLAAVHAVAAYVGQKMQNEARQGAPWTDRTGNARSGLFFAVEGLGLPPIVGTISGVDLQGQRDVVEERAPHGTLLLALSHTMYYGKYLELSHGARYAIVVSTFEGNLPVLESMLKELVR